MTTKKIYSPWIEWHGGERPVPPYTVVKVQIRSGKVLGPNCASAYLWNHAGEHGDIVEYCVAAEQPDLDAAEKLLRDNGYTVTKPLTFEDVTPLTEAPPKGTPCWVPQPFRSRGVEAFIWVGNEQDLRTLKHRMAYHNREHALIAARHIFGLKGGEL